MKKVTVRIDAQGKVTIEAHGYAGASCEEATRFLERLGDFQSREIKPEFFLPATEEEGLKA